MEMATKEDIRELRQDVSKLTEMVGQLIRVEERQTAQGTRLSSLENLIAQVVETQAKDRLALEEKLSRTNAELQKWVNRGWGAWGAVVIVFAILNAPTFIAAMRGH